MLLSSYLWCQVSLNENITTIRTGFMGLNLGYQVLLNGYSLPYVLMPCTSNLIWLQHLDSSKLERRNGKQMKERKHMNMI